MPVTVQVEPVFASSFVVVVVNSVSWVAHDFGSCFDDQSVELVP